MVPVILGSSYHIGLFKSLFFQEVWIWCYKYRLSLIHPPTATAQTLAPNYAIGMKCQRLYILAEVETLVFKLYNWYYLSQ